MTPSLWKTTASLLKWRAGSNSVCDGAKIIDLRKNEKKATKQAAQKVMSDLWPKFKLEKIPCKIAGNGKFGMTGAP